MSSWDKDKAALDSRDFSDPQNGVTVATAHGFPRACDEAAEWSQPITGEHGISMLALARQLCVCVRVCVPVFAVCRPSTEGQPALCCIR